MCRHKFPEVIDKDVGTGNPLPVELAPNGFSPAGVGEGEVQALFVEVVPVRAGDDVSQRIGEVVGYHFGVTGCARGEIEQRGVVVGVGQGGTLEGGGGFDAGMEIEPAFGYGGTYRHAVLQRGGVGDRAVDVPDDGCCAYGDNHLYVGRVAAVDDVFLGEQVGGGYAHGSDFVQCDNREPELIAAFEYEHHHVAAFDAERQEKRGGLVAFALDVGKGEVDVVVFLVGPAKGFFVGRDAGPFVYDVVSEVEILGYVYVEVFDEIFLRGKFRLFQKFL